MEDHLGLWLTPVLLLPGVALLLISTVTRSGQIDAELHRMLDNKDNNSRILAGHLLTRSTLVRNAIVCMYVSVGLFSLASFLGGLTAVAAEWTSLSHWIMVGLTCLGILGLIAAAHQLIRESFISLEIVREHSGQIGFESQQ